MSRLCHRGPRPRPRPHAPLQQEGRATHSKRRLGGSCLSPIPKEHLAFAMMSGSLRVGFCRETVPDFQAEFQVSSSCRPQLGRMNGGPRWEGTCPQTRERWCARQLAKAGPFQGPQSPRDSKAHWFLVTCLVRGVELEMQQKTQVSSALRFSSRTRMTKLTRFA